MSKDSSNSKRIAKNSFFLYFRMLFLMIVSLYTSRIILNALGVVDYGIYNVVGGVVTMFSMISGSLSTAISRFLTFAIGKGEEQNLCNIFSTSVNIQIIIAFIILILTETIGVWFLNTKIVIPDDRLNAANWVFQFSIITFIINLISVPYNATIIAHEHMSAFAYISIIEAVGKLVIAYFIIINPIDRLIFFSLMVTLLSLIIRIIYGQYCKKHFSETAYHFILKKKLLKDMFGFAGWNFLGSSAMILREYGGNILINLFCGPAINAAKSIASKVNSTTQGFVNSFMMAINPQITKSYAIKDFNYMFTLINQGARLSFYMMLLLSLPIIFNVNYILKLWLVTVPEHTNTFVCLTLILTMSDVLSNTLITAILSTGKVKKYQIAISSLQILNIPISYICLVLGCIPEIVIVIAIIISNLALFLRLIMLRKVIPINIPIFIKKVYLNVLSVSFLSSIIPYYFSQIFVIENLSRFFILSSVSITCTLLVIFFVGCNSKERLKIKNKAKFLYYKKFSK